MVHLPLDKHFLKGAMTSWGISGPYKATEANKEPLTKGSSFCSSGLSKLGAYIEYTPILKDRQNKIQFWPSLQAKRPFLRSTL